MEKASSPNHCCAVSSQGSVLSIYLLAQGSRSTWHPHTLRPMFPLSSSPSPFHLPPTYLIPFFHPPSLLPFSPSLMPSFPLPSLFLSNTRRASRSRNPLWVLETITNECLCLPVSLLARSHLEMPIKRVTSILGERRCGAKIGGAPSWVVRVEAPQVSIKTEASCQVKGAGDSHRAREASVAPGSVCGRLARIRGSAPGLCSTAETFLGLSAAIHSCVPLEIQMCSKRKDQEAINYAGTCS